MYTGFQSSYRGSVGGGGGGGTAPWMPIISDNFCY